MSQLSFFSAESVPPAVADLTGVLAGPGQIVLAGNGVRQAARISVVVDEMWRAQGLAQMISEAGLVSEISRTDENNPLVRTALDPQLMLIAGEWTRGPSKPCRRGGCRALVSCGPGRWRRLAGGDDRYLLGLDPHAPDTHAALAAAMMRVGIAPTLIGTRGSHPALRISGRRRLSRLVENVGNHPGCLRVGALATYLMVDTRRASLRRLAGNAKLSVAGRGAATIEVERRHVGWR